MGTKRGSSEMYFVFSVLRFFCTLTTDIATEIVPVRTLPQREESHLRTPTAITIQHTIIEALQSRLVLNRCYFSK